MTIGSKQRCISFAVCKSAYAAIAYVAAKEGVAVGAIVRTLVHAAFAPDVAEKINRRDRRKPKPSAPTTPVKEFLPGLTMEPGGNDTVVIRRAPEPERLPEPGDEPLAGVLLNDSDIKAMLLKGRAVPYICGRWRLPYARVRAIKDKMTNAKV